MLRSLGTVWLAIYAASAACPQIFEVASVKANTSGERFTRMRPPAGGSFTATNASLRMLISLAYRMKDLEISGGPAWLASDRFDVAVKTGDPNTIDDQFRLMLQNLLADRFKLKTHRETRVVPIYILSAARSGVHLSGAKPQGCSLYGEKGKDALPPCGPFALDAGETTRLEGKDTSMAALVSGLASILGRPVTDETGFKGTFDVRLEFAAPDAPVKESSAPSIFTVLQDELGLKLESQKGAAEVLVIDRAERPAKN